MAHFIKSQKRTKSGEESFLLVDADEYVYRFKRVNKTEAVKVWKCTELERLNCKAEVKTNLNGVSKKHL